MQLAALKHSTKTAPLFVQQSKTLCFLTMNRSNCPKCNEDIVYAQLMKHTWKKPIVCRSCGAAMKFDQKAWYKLMLFPVIASALLLSNIFLGSYLFSKNDAVLVSVVALILLAATSLRFALQVGRVKLVLVGN